VPSESSDDLRFLQERLSLYGATVAALAGLFLVVGTATGVALGAEWFSEPSRAWHVVATGFAVALWLSTRHRHVLSAKALNVLDASGTLGMCAAFAVMGHVTPAVGTLIALLAISYVALGRAAQLPSTPTRTLVITALSFACVVASAATSPVPPGYPATPMARVFATLDPILWSVAGTALATVASKVIYGLQEKVLEARQLGQYTLEAKIGQGGMGEVYRARHAMLRRPTAIKLLPGEHSELQLRRFEREVQLTASLTHPNIVSVFDFGRTPEGTFYYAMELLEGLNLETLVERYGPQHPGRVVEILVQVCSALNEAHAVGMIHRDIKPANIYLCKLGTLDDVVKVLDFGLVRQENQDATLSQTGAQTLVGTPLYMAPETIQSPERIGSQADLYSLGATAYYLLTGSPPFRGASVLEVCSQHLYERPEPPSERLGKELPAELETLVLACLAKDPGARPKSAAALAVELRAAAGIPSWSAEDARRFWTEAKRDVDDGARVSLPEKTVHVDLGRRIAGLPIERAS
jgi:serine/threonine-protein kinase